METEYPSSYWRQTYHVAILCAKECEMDAVRAMFGKPSGPPKLKVVEGDQNIYSFGRIGNHNVALGYLPGMGVANAASAAASFLTSFPRIRLALVVGICGGVPVIDGEDGTHTEVLLGDVIISTRVIQYRDGTQRPDSFNAKNTLGKSGKTIESFVRQMKGIINRAALVKKTSCYTLDLTGKTGYGGFKYPGADKDRLYNTHYRHKHHQQKDPCETCRNCNEHEGEVCKAALDAPCEVLGCSEVVPRRRLEESSAMPELLVHFGVVASGGAVMKSGYHRDEIVANTGEKIIAFEMEGAGVWDTLPTLVIKGVSDYADSHKRDDWQKFASARAAACMKAIIEEWAEVDLGDLIHEDRALRARIPESGTSDVREKIDRAEALIQTEDQRTMKKDLEGAKKLLEKALKQSGALSSDSLIRVYWGLMIVEKKLSCDRSITEVKLSHIKEAEIWKSKILSQNLDTDTQNAVTLEGHIIRGRKARLELKLRPESVEARRAKDDAIREIDGILEELKEKNLNKYNDTVKYVQQWRLGILRTP